MNISTAGSNLTWDPPFFTQNGKKFTPRIYTGNIDIHQEFNTVTIPLDGRIHSNLDWKAAQEKARQWVEKGLWLFWELDMGLFANLQFPLSNQTQFHSLGIALEQFRKLIWPEFQNQTLGLCLYKGSIDFTFIWDEVNEQQFQEWLSEANIPQKDSRLQRLFCQEIALSYIQQLVSYLPAALFSFVCLDALSIQNPLERALLLTHGNFDYLHRAVKNDLFSTGTLAWEIGETSLGYISSTPLPENALQNPREGICLPSGILARFSYPELERAFAAFLEKKIPVRLLTEETLTSSWDGLDSITVSEKGISEKGMRKLKGFSAAGGEIKLVK